jgi:hypothetical protein
MAQTSHCDRPDLLALRAARLCQHRVSLGSERTRPRPNDALHHDHANAHVNDVHGAEGRTTDIVRQGLL